MALTAGDRVIVPHMPGLGIGVVEWAGLGRVLVSFEAGGQYRDEFGEGELSRAQPSSVRAGP